MKCFSSTSVSSIGDGTFFFTGAMVSSCAPLFDDCYDNYDVVAKLRKAEVIDDTCEEDSESCQMWVIFRTWSDATKFVERLNAYLLKKQELLKTAEAF